MRAFMWGLLIGAFVMEMVFILLICGEDIKEAISKFIIDRRAARERRLHDAVTTSVRLRMANIDRQTFERIAAVEREANEGS